MSLPDTISVDGVRYKRLDRTANRVSSHAMYDCHLFRPLKGASVDALIADWRQECANPDDRYGAPYLCPVIVMDDDKELRRVGKMVFRESEIPAFRDALLADPDVSRILAERAANPTTPVQP